MPADVRATLSGPELTGRSIFADHKVICAFVADCQGDTLPTCVLENECVFGWSRTGLIAS